MDQEFRNAQSRVEWKVLESVHAESRASLEESTAISNKEISGQGEDFVDNLFVEGRLLDRIENLSERELNVSFMSFDRTGDYLAVGALNGDVIAWDFRTLVIMSLMSHVEIASSLVWSNNSKFVYIVSAFGVSVWDVLEETVSDHLNKENLSRYPLESAELVSDNDSDALLVGTAIGAPLIFYPKTGTYTRLKIEDSENQHYEVAVCSESRRILCVSKRGSVVLFDSLGNPIRFFSVSVSKRDVVRISISQDEKRLCVSYEFQRPDPSCIVYDLSDETSSFRLSTSASIGPLSNVSCARHADYYLGIGEKNKNYSLVMWNKRGRLVRTLQEDMHSPHYVQSDKVRILLCHPKRSVVAVLRDDGSVVFWDKLLLEKWSSYVSDFQSVESNVEYLENEAELDLNLSDDEEEAEKKQKMEKERLQDVDEDMDVLNEDPSHPSKRGPVFPVFRTFQRR